MASAVMAAAGAETRPSAGQDSISEMLTATVEGIDAAGKAFDQVIVLDREGGGS